MKKSIQPRKKKSKTKRAISRSEKRKISSTRSKKSKSKRSEKRKGGSRSRNRKHKSFTNTKTQKNKRVLDDIMNPGVNTSIQTKRAISRSEKRKISPAEPEKSKSKLKFPSDFILPYTRKTTKEKKYNKKQADTLAEKNIHYGQIKLLLSEMEVFLLPKAKTIKYVIYAGAAPGVHTSILAKFLPHIEWHL